MDLAGRFAAVNVRVLTVAKADARGRVVVVVVVVVSDIVKRRAVKITLTCFNSFHIFGCCSFSFFPVDGILEHEHCRNTKIS